MKFFVHDVNLSLSTGTCANTRIIYINSCNNNNNNYIDFVLLYRFDK